MNFFFDYLKKEIKEKRKMGHFTEINKINDQKAYCFSFLFFYFFKFKFYGQ